VQNPKEAHMPTVHRTWSVAGPFDLARTAAFSFGAKDAELFDGTYRMAFCLDGYRSSAGVVVRQPSARTVEFEVIATGGSEVEVAVRQAARILSIDVDAGPFLALAERDPVLAPLVAAAPGLRPPLFSSAYEALAWAVLSARRPRRQMTEVRNRLAAEYGQRFVLAGSPLFAFPLPESLLRVVEFPGLTAEKIRRLHGIARAALDGTLDTATLRGLPPAEAAARARGLEGIGPFYSELLTVRALGHTDVLPSTEPQVRARLAGLLGTPDDVTQAQFERLAQAWRPWRTWACVYLRAVDPEPGRAGGRVSAPPQMADAGPSAIRPSA
jgi:DNA-3-methyladenine glycosylase II